MKHMRCFAACRFGNEPFGEVFKSNTTRRSSTRWPLRLSTAREITGMMVSSANPSVRAAAASRFAGIRSVPAVVSCRMLMAYSSSAPAQSPSAYSHTPCAAQRPAGSAPAAGQWPPPAAPALAGPKRLLPRLGCCPARRSTRQSRYQLHRQHPLVPHQPYGDIARGGEQKGPRHLDLAEVLHGADLRTGLLHDIAHLVTAEKPAQIAQRLPLQREDFGDEPAVSIGGH